MAGNGALARPGERPWREKEVQEALEYLGNLGEVRAQAARSLEEASGVQAVSNLLTRAEGLTDGIDGAMRVVKAEKPVGMRSALRWLKEAKSIAMKLETKLSDIHTSYGRYED